MNMATRRQENASLGLAYELIISSEASFIIMVGSMAACSRHGAGEGAEKSAAVGQDL